MTEILDDTASVLLPAREEDLRAAFSRLKIGQILAGARGAPPVPLEPILDTIKALEAFILTQAAALEEIEINPLIVTDTQAIVADALIRRRQ